jgi:hypothetical protein
MWSWGWLLATLWVACDAPGECPPGSTFSPHFGQCVGVEPDDEPPPPPAHSSATSTGDTGDSA